MMLTKTRLAWGLLALMVLICAQPAAAEKIVLEGGIIRDVDNFSPAGIDLGKEGFWFANFDRLMAVSGEPVDSNDVNQFPSWILPDFDPMSPDYSFGDEVSSAGDPLYDILRLPDGTTGASGSLVDAEADNNSNNTMKRLVLGQGVPSSFFMHVVVDNTNGEHDPGNRVRGRAESADGMISEDFRYNTSPSDFNGTADVYTFRYDNWEPGDFLKIQLNSGVDGIDPGFAGLMFDIPEPMGLSLVLLGLMAVGLVRRHR